MSAAKVNIPPGYCPENKRVSGGGGTTWATVFPRSEEASEHTF